MSEKKPEAIKKKRKKKEPKLKGLFASGALFIGDAQFFAGSPQIELDPTSGRMMDVTPIDPLNPFNTLDRVLELAGEEDKALEIAPYITGRGVLLQTQRNQGSYIVKPKKKAGKVVGYVIQFID